MRQLTFHPSKGFLNTKFAIHATGFSGKRIVVKPIELENTCTIFDTQTRYFNIESDSFNEHVVLAAAGNYSVCIEGEESSTIFFRVEDAIKFGGSIYKDSFVFEGTPWCFIVKKDRTYFYNRETQESYEESISPDKIEYVNRNFVLFYNSTGQGGNDITLYSLVNQLPTTNFNLLVYKSEKTIITCECNDDINELTLFNLDINDFRHVGFSCKAYCVNESSGCVYLFMGEKEVLSVDFDSFGSEKITVPSSFVGFTNSQYMLYRSISGYGETVGLFDLTSKKGKEIYKSEYPILSVEDNVLFSDKEDREKTDMLFERAKELSLLKTVRIELNNVDLKRVYVTDDNIYVHVLEHRYFINRFGKNKKETISYIISNNKGKENKIEVDNNAKIKIMRDELHVSSYRKYAVIKDGTVIFETDDTVHTHGNIVLFSKYDNSTELVCCYYDNRLNKIAEGKFEWAFFEKFGILKQTSDVKVIYAFSPEMSNGRIKYERFKYDFVSLISKDNILKTESKLLYAYSCIRWDKNILLPEYHVCCSENSNYVISIRGSKIYFNSLTDGVEGQHYDSVEILNDFYDTSSYKNVLFSDDGRNIVYQDGEDMVSLDVYSEEETRFPNLSYVSHKNGYRAMVAMDHYRRPRIIDPLTRNYIDEEYTSQYKFISPDGMYYADTKLKAYVKYQNEITGEILSDEDYERMREKYDYLYGTDKTREKKQMREEYIDKHIDCFRKYYSKNYAGEFQKSRLLDINYFTSLFFVPLGYAYIRRCGSDSIVAEIPLGPELWYLNYVAFSMDSRYVGIVGRYPDNTWYNGHMLGGLLLIYDLEKKKTVTTKTSSWAVWSIAFSKGEKWAAYSGEPIAYCSVNAEESYMELRGKSFMTFSPDGKYIAFSEQGYIPYSKGRHSNWGHQPSTNIYIHSAENSDYKLLQQISDLADVGVEGTYSAASVVSCSFSLDNSKLMMAGKDGTVVIRNLHLNQGMPTKLQDNYN